MAELNFENIDLGSFGINQEPVEQPLKTTMSEAIKINPDQQAHINKLSSQSGIPPFALQKDTKPIEDRLKLDQIDFESLSKETPNTADFFTSFDNAAVAHDDVETLSGIERIFDFRKTFQNIGESIKESFKSQVEGTVAVGIDTAPTRIEDIIPMSALPIGMENEAFDISKQFAANFGIQTNEQLEQAKNEAVEKMIVRLRESKAVMEKLQPDDLNLLEQGVRGGVESLAQMAPGFGLMLLSGGASAPMLATMGVQSFGSAYADARAEGLSPEKANWYGLIDAGIEVGTEILPLGTLENFITGEVKGLGKQALKFAIQEMGTEQLATLGQSLNQYIFGLDLQMEQAETVSDMVQIQMQRQAVTAIATVVAGGAQLGIATGIRKSMDALQSDETRKQQEYVADQQTIDRLNDQSEKSKLKARDKEAFRNFVEKADGENNSTVFIDGSQAALYLQTKTQEEINADPALRKLSEQVREAAATGGEVQIPVADFAADFTGTEHFEALRDSMTMNENTISPFRQEQARVETLNYVQRMMQTAQGDISQYAEAQDIYQKVRQQLIDTGRVTPQNASVMANLVPAWATAKAIRDNKTVQQVYEDSGLVIEGPLTGEKARLEAEFDMLTQDMDYDQTGDIVQNENFKKWFADSKVVNEQGQPLVVYHGSKENFDTFDISYLGQQGRAEGTGFYFTPDEKIAKGYAEGTGNLYKVFLNLKKPIEYNQKGFNKVTLKKILKKLAKLESEKNGVEIADGFLSNYGDVRYDGIDRVINEAVFLFSDEETILDQMGGLVGSGVDPALVNEAVQTITGYDGVHAKGFSNQGGSDIYVAFFPTQIKSTSNRGTFDPADPNILRQEINQPFYSALEKGVESVQQEKAQPDQWLGMIKKIPGLKQEEMEWVGVREWLAEQKGPVSKQDVLDFVRANGVEVREVEKGDRGRYSISELVENNSTDKLWVIDAPGQTFQISKNKYPTLESAKKYISENKQRDDVDVLPPKFSQYQLPGGDNYKELLLTLPVRQVPAPIQEKYPFKVKAIKGGVVEKIQYAVTQDEASARAEKIAADPYYDSVAIENNIVMQDGKSYKSSHFDEPNILAHVRFNERTDADGNRVLFLEEIQSDWHQEGRRQGYSLPSKKTAPMDSEYRALVHKNAEAVERGETPNAEDVKRAQELEIALMQSDASKIPDAPFKKSWPLLAFKRMVRYAAENGFDKVAWTTGEQQAARYDLSKQVDSVDYRKRGEDKYTVVVKGLDGQQVYARREISAVELENVIGKELSKKIVDTASDDLKTLSGLDLKVGGEGMKGFYDKILPAEVNKFFKKWGVKTKVIDLPNTGEQLSIDITPELKDTVLTTGLPLFQPISADAPGSRGYYSPERSLIRLTEASDLSTFLHEYAHFMLDMEKRSETDMSQSIMSWYKRDADAVAKEASRYLDKEYDAEKQFDQTAVDTSSENFKKWFADSKVVDEQGAPLVVYHGSPVKGITEFDPKKIDKNSFLGRGFYFSPFSGEVQKYTNGVGEVLPAYVSLKNPVEIKGYSGREAVPLQVIRSAIKEIEENKDKDGIILWGSELGKPVIEEIMVVAPTQIKSTSNRGTFDPTDPNILRQPVSESKVPGGIITPEQVIGYIDFKSTGDKAVDAAINRAIHERFARGFESYLMEGKAPSLELRNAFATIARWLTQIYKAIRDSLNVNLDNEMRQIYDRLLATDEQIAAAEARARFEPMFTDAAMAGMTEEEFLVYKKKQEKVKDKQVETLRDKLIEQLTRQTKKWWKDEKADIAREEADKIKTEKVYIATTRLKSPGEFKLDFATVKEMIGEEKVDKRGRKSTRVSPKLNGMTAKEHQGIHPDQAAAMLGYDSGAEMLNDIINAPSVNDLANTRAEAIMIERHGDIMNDGTIERAADDAVQNEERGKLILQELKVLSRDTTVPTIDRATVKAIAKQRIGELSFREIFPGKYRKAEIKAAQEAVTALNAGDRNQAAAAKLRQVMNYYLGMEASEAKANTMKIVDRMARYNKKQIREEIMKAGNDYWDQLDKILNRFEFRKSASLKSVENINIWMKNQIENEGAGLVLSNAVLNEGYITHWKNVPYSDLQGINDSVKNIEHVARYSNKIDVLQEKVDFQKVVNDWIDSMNEKVESKFTPVASSADAPTKWKKWGRWSMAQMTKIPFMASWLDGGERVGLSHQILVQRFTDAYDAEVRLWDEAARPVMDLILNRSKEDIKRHNTKYFIPEIAGTAFHTGNLMGHEIIVVALNTGNKSNLRKLLLGEGWANPEDESTITFQNPKLQAVLSKMTNADWNLVQTIWNQMETLYPLLAEVHRKTTGLTPPQIEKTPIEVQGMRLEGGYYPMKYDPSRDNRVQEHEDKLNAQVESMFSTTASIQASVNTGATNERTKYYAPVRLSLDVVQNHFQEVIHYITHHDAVRQVNKLIRNNEVANTIKAKLGPDEYAQLKPWLNDIAKDGKEAPVKMFWDDVLQKLRFGITLGVMGFKASTGIIQVSGLSNTIAEMGTANTFQAIRSILGSPADMKGAWEFASENSKVMNHRVNTMDREIKNTMSKLADKKGLKAAVQEASMKHIALIQTYMVDLPTWHAGYIAEMKRSGNEQKAYQYADWAVENIQGSGATKDMAQIMRGQSETGRMLTMFMTYFSSLWNLQRDLVRGARSGRYSVTTLAAKSAFLLVIPVLFEMLMRGELTGDDEPEEKLQRALTGVAMYPIQSIPFVRDIATATFGDYGYNISPVASLIEQGTRSIPGLLEAAITDEEITKSQVKGATKVIGAAAGIPGVNQAWATGEHLYQVMQEGEELTLHQLLFGPRRK